MFRNMRRFRQALPNEECIDILNKCSSGVLAVAGDEGYPYAVPMSYGYANGKIFFHCAKAGHKMDAIARCDKASFCVVAQDDVSPEKFTTLFKSVIAFGRLRILSEESEIRAAMAVLGEKYSPGDEVGMRAEVDKSYNRLCVMELGIEHLSGKEAIELTSARAKA